MVRAVFDIVLHIGQTAIGLPCLQRHIGDVCAVMDRQNAIDQHNHHIGPGMGMPARNRTRLEIPAGDPHTLVIKLHGWFGGNIADKSHGAVLY